MPADGPPGRGPGRGGRAGPAPVPSRGLFRGFGSQRQEPDEFLRPLADEPAGIRGVGIYTDKTKTTFYGKEVKFKLNQASLGLVYRPIVWKMLEPFVGAGFEIYSYSEKIEGDALPGTSGNAFGFHVQGGTYVNIYKFLAGKVFVRLNGVKKTLSEALPDGTTKLDLGGKEFGVGLIFKF
jgi:hypothetical protein